MSYAVYKRCPCHPQANGHFFGTILVCKKCGKLWSEHQRSPAACDKPHRHRNSRLVAQQRVQERLGDHT